MKTRLLKRLRKQAKKHYIIVYFPDRVFPYSVYQTDGYLYYSQKPFKNLDEATEWAMYVRRNYVASEVKAMKRERMKPIKLDI